MNNSLLDFLEKLGPVKIRPFRLYGEGAQVVWFFRLVGTLVEVPAQADSLEIGEPKYFGWNLNYHSPTDKVPYDTRSLFCS
jgi:hypothetical protein